MKRVVLKLTEENETELRGLCKGPDWEEVRISAVLREALERALDAVLTPVDEFDMDKPVVRFELR